MSLKVDLTLAVNYLPACSCLAKMLVFMLAMTLIPAGSEVDGLVFLAAMLYVDRLVTRNIIFDANAILLAVLFANAHAGVRAVSSQRAFQTLVDGMFIFWAMGSLVLICEPRSVKLALDRRPSWAKIVPVLLMLLIVVAISHFHAELEPGGVRCCRALAFTLLSFAWIYIVGIRTPHGIEYLKENSCQFVARLSPVLYVSVWIAVAFTICAVGGFVMQYMRMVEADSSTAGASSHTYQQLQMIHCQEDGVAVTVNTGNNNNDSAAAPAALTTHAALNTPRKADEDEEELFRLARLQSMSARRTLPLEPIREGQGGF
jgi:hypothetical protein